MSRQVFSYLALIIEFETRADAGIVWGKGIIQAACHSTVVGIRFIFWYKHCFDAHHAIVQEYLQSSGSRIRRFLAIDVLTASSCTSVVSTLFQAFESLVSYISKVFHLHADHNNPS